MGRTRNSGREPHKAGRHTLSLARFVKELCSMIGSEQSILISLDDKDRIKLGNTAINKQQKILISTKKPTLLPDHDLSKEPDIN